jgi:WhiB family transcriptional regulator, redox-sensing transcriptional regulator
MTSRRATRTTRRPGIATAMASPASHDFSVGKLQMTQSIISATEARAAWVSNARCRSTDPDELFVRGAAQKKAAMICRHCPVITECAADALDNRIEFGVWGGMTERQRRALLKQHREVDSWAEFFAAQREHRNASQPA